MRDLYKEFFRVRDSEKITEKVMATRVVTTVIVMIACLAAMCFSAYAYFSHDVISEHNNVTAASFETVLSISLAEKSSAESSVVPITSNNKAFKVDGLSVGKWYTVTVTPTAKSTAKTGFLIISADGCDRIYHTKQLGVDERVDGKKTEAITFKLMITDPTTVRFKAHWGTSSHYSTGGEQYIADELKMVINGVEEPPASESEQENEQEDEQNVQELDKTEPETEESGEDGAEEITQDEEITQ